MSAEKAAKLEEQVKQLKEELEVCKEAKTTSDACAALSEFAQKNEVSLSSCHFSVHP